MALTHYTRKMVSLMILMLLCLVHVHSQDSPFIQVKTPYLDDHLSSQRKTMASGGGSLPADVIRYLYLSGFFDHAGGPPMMSDDLSAWNAISDQNQQEQKRFNEFLGGRKKRFSEFLGGKKRTIPEHPWMNQSGIQKRFTEFLGGKRSSNDLEMEKRFTEFLGGKRNAIPDRLSKLSNPDY